MNSGDALSREEMIKEAGRIGDYADGFYFCKCRECSRTFVGDKYASQCLPCAVKDLTRWARHGKACYERAPEELARINQELGLE